MIRFAHLADCHLGAWREPELSDLNFKTFEKALEICREEKVDFILIAGDLLNTSMPGVEVLVNLASLLKKLKEQKIEVYVVEGSHDYSPTGKTMLKVLDSAGLLHLVAKGKISEGKIKLTFTQDEKTKVKIAGVKGLKGSLEEKTYQNLLRENLENEEGFKIFLFHSGLIEYKPEELKEMKAVPLSFLPGNFNYYAGGHVHQPIYEKYNKGVITFPGALFPTDMREMEKQNWGGFYIITVEKGKIRPERHEIKLAQVEVIRIEGERKTLAEVEKEIREEVKKRELKGKIVLLKLSGTLSSGRAWQLDMREITQKIQKKEPLVLKLNNQLTSKEFQEVRVDSQKPKEIIEKELIKENLGKVKISHPDEKTLIVELMTSLNQEKGEDEVSRDYKERIIKESLKALHLEELWNDHQ